LFDNKLELNSCSGKKKYRNKLDI